MKIKRFAFVLGCFLIFIFGRDLYAGNFKFTTKQRYVTIPVETSNHLMLVEVRINDSYPLNFIIDTGVKTTLITEPLLASILDLKSTESIILLGLGQEGFLQAALVRGVKLNLPGLEGEGFNLAILPETNVNFSEIFGKPVHGIIGYDLLKDFPVLINYRDKYIRFYNRANYPKPRKSVTLPLPIRDSKPYIKIVLEAVNGDTIQTEVLLDMGASHPLYLNQRFKNLVPVITDTYLGRGISGELFGVAGRLSSISFGPFVLKSPIASFPNASLYGSNDNFSRWPGLLGGSVLSRFIFVLDYNNQLIHIRKTFKLRAPFFFNPSGLEVIATGISNSQFVIHYVRPGSPAYLAGLLPGDQILSVNQIFQKNLTLDNILSEINAPNGSMIRMTVSREFKTHTYRFKLREDI